MMTKEQKQWLNSIDGEAAYLQSILGANSDVRNHVARIWDYTNFLRKSLQ